MNRYIGIALLLVPSVSWAFGFSDEFAQHPFGHFGGGGGIYFTGSPRSNDGMDCSHCHVGASQWQNRIQLDVAGQRVTAPGVLVDDDFFLEGYIPGEQYKVTVTLLGEHRGKCTSNGEYQGPAGEPFKMACPHDSCNGQGVFPLNRDHMTAEVMSEDEVYASFNGTSAGQLRPDSTAGPTETGDCHPGPSWCNGPDQYPAGPEWGWDDGDGPTTLMFSSWRLTDPNSGPMPFGKWECITDCDAVNSNMGRIAWSDSVQLADGTNPEQRSWSFFWRAPDTAPEAGAGRIRFYIAALDGDGYVDVFDDDMAFAKVATCPQGNDDCTTDVGPGWLVGSTTVNPGHNAAALALMVAALLATGVLLTRSRRPAAVAWASTLVLLVWVATSAGCVVVKPWERGRLATNVMTEGPDIGEAMCEQTFLGAREGATGGSAVGPGGGCACN